MALRPKIGGARRSGSWLGCPMSSIEPLLDRRLVWSEPFLSLSGQSHGARPAAIATTTAIHSKPSLAKPSLGTAGNLMPTLSCRIVLQAAAAEQQTREEVGWIATGQLCSRWLAHFQLSDVTRLTRGVHPRSLEFCSQPPPRPLFVSFWLSAPGEKDFSGLRLAARLEGSHCTSAGLYRCIDPCANPET